MCESGLFTVLSQKNVFRHNSTISIGLKYVIQVFSVIQVRKMCDSGIFTVLSQKNMSRHNTTVCISKSDIFTIQSQKIVSRTICTSPNCALSLFQVKIE